MAITTSAHNIIAERCGAPLPERFWELVGGYREALIDQACAILGNRSDAEDVAQETLVEAYGRPGRLGDARSIGACLFMMNKANALDRLRNRGREIHRKHRRLAAHPARFATTGGITLVESSEALAQAVESLPPRERTILSLRFREDLTFDEISRRVRLPVSTVHRICFEATRTLYSSLQGR